MKRLNKTDRNKYVITLHDDIVDAIERLQKRAKEVGKDYLLYLDTFISGAIFTHLEEIANDIKKAELAQLDKAYRIHAEYGITDRQQIKEFIQREQK